MAAFSISALQLIDLKRRSAQAFTIFANEERDRLLKTRPDLPMGLVTRMMVEKWRNLDSEAKKPYFDASRASPPLKTVKGTNDSLSEIIPTKKWRPVVSYTQPISNAPTQTVRVDQPSEQAQGRVIIVQGKLGAPVLEVSKAREFVFGLFFYLDFAFFKTVSHFPSNVSSSLLV
ncbi:unnamed protein product [Strongylus vulgaris]|uniref:HMG box domain-containing protein n=1 Tax=Strongylus vulgaris TaxID=40348 RepID=A0A3P7KGG7_STRVU|nr:unnamed protein product [Strongylus vulgaris]